MYSSETVFRFAPDIYEDNETMLAIYDAQKGELNRYQAIIQRVFLNNLVKYCNVEGIRRFEDIFHIQADELTESLDFRKARIINKFNQLPPFTRIFVEQMLQNVFGTGNWDFQVGQSDTDLINYYTKVNNPTISEDGIASGFSSSNYIRMTIPDLSTSNNWELVTPIFQTGDIVGNDLRHIMKNYNDNTFRITAGAGSEQIAIQYKIGETSTTCYTGKFATAEGSQIKIVNNNGNFSFYYRNKQNPDWALTSNQPTATGSMEISTDMTLGWHINNSYCWEGSIDLKDFKITRNDYIIYQAAERNPFIAEIMLESDIQGLIAETFKDLRQIIPANIDIRETIYYPYVHGYLKRHYTHEEMQQFTHGDLKNG